MKILLAALALIVVVTPASGQDFAAGLDAYDRGDFESALREWHPLAERGDARAQFNLGALHFNGQGVAYDPVEAAKWYRAAADQGYGPAQANLAFLYESGQGLLQNYIEAYKWATLAARHGSETRERRENLAAKMTADQIAEAQRAAAAWRPVAAAAAPQPAPAGSPPPVTEPPPAARDSSDPVVVTAPRQLAQEPGGPKVVSAPEPQADANARSDVVPPTRDQVRETQRLLNDIGFAAGPADGIAGRQTRKAVRDFQSENGLPVTGNITDDLIAQLTERLAAARPPGQDQIATRPPEARPAGPNPAAAAASQPSEAGDCDRLAGHPDDQLLPDGVAGVAFDDIDTDRAIAACEAALAENPGNPRYQVQLARSLHKAERLEEAVVYYQQAGLQGHALAQKSLGFAYAAGLGVTQNYAKAAEWHHLAAEQGDSDAQHNLGFLYADGRGVPRDLIQAHMWYNIAAAHGSPGAAEKRELLASQMTEQQVFEAERRAATWFQLHPESLARHNN